VIACVATDHLERDVQIGIRPRREIALRLLDDDARVECALQLLGKQLQLPDIDFDTGKPTIQGEYGLADLTYSQLLLYLQDQKYKDVTPPLQANILSFYGKGDTTSKVTEYKKYKVDWKKTYLALQQLKTVRPVPIDSLKLPIDTVSKTSASKTK